MKPTQEHIIRLTEKELIGVIKKVISEQQSLKQSSKKWLPTNTNLKTNVCGPGFVALTTNEIKQYSNQINKPWASTTDGSGDWKQLSNGTICKRAILRGKDANSKFTGMSVSTFMEGLREFLNSGTGIVIQVILDMLPMFGGPIMNIIAWSILTVYDFMIGVYQNKWDFYNIICDVVAIVTTGVGVSAVKTALAPVKPFIPKLSSKGISSLPELAKMINVKTPSLFVKLKSWFKGLTKVISTISKHISKFINVIGPKIKGTIVYDGLMKIQSFLTRSLPDFLGRLENSFNIIPINPKYVGHAVNIGKDAAKTHAINTGLSWVNSGVQ